jgi:hypothetical protein
LANGGKWTFLPPIWEGLTAPPSRPPRGSLGTISTAGYHCRTFMTAEDKKFAMHVTAEAAKQIPPLYEEVKESYKRDMDEADRVADRFIRIAEMRISFFEKIILLAGGTFALSLTFLGSLQHHNLGSPITAMWSLEGSWVLLLSSIFLSWLHNRHRLFVIESVTFAVAARVRSLYEWQRGLLLARAGKAFKGVEIPDLDLTAFFNATAKTTAKSSVDAEKMREQMVEVAKTSWTIARKLGDFALLSIACAFFLALLFAVRNASLL